ncbi:uncharacterized protein LOC143325468 [Chaetodon auriga]|uniref:uncharacterized protein LOC143325468 n=1 Tax=Chaetodon auriga TaxID=39042 RepID=UPI004032A5C7
MERYLKITASLLLLVQAFHLASLQYTTESTGRTIDKSWLRELAKNTAGSQNAAVPGEEAEYDQTPDATAMESSNDYSSGIASGSMAGYTEEEENVTGRDKDADDGSDDLTVVTTTVPPTIQNVTTKQPEQSTTTVSPTTAPTNSSQLNMTDTKKEFHNSTTHLSAQNSTSVSDNSKPTDLQTVAPEGNNAQGSTTKPDKDASLTNATDATNKTTVTTTTTPEINETPTTSSSTTAAALNTPEKANKTEKGSASGGSSERGLESETHTSKRNEAWGAVLGTGVAVAFLGLVAYLILKKKNQMGFSHRKLVEEYPSDPVLRLDNSEPLDLNFGGSAYYNPGLQGDNIQMNNLPGRY